MKDMFVWRKSVYDNNFKCNQCGAKLFNPNTGHPTDNLVVDAEDADSFENNSTTEPIYCYCGRCKNAVATWQPVESDAVDENILQGSYSDWIDKKAVDMKAEIQRDIEYKVAKKYEQKIKLLEDEITSKNAQIKRLKSEYEKQLLEKDQRIQKISKELYHTEVWMHKMSNLLDSINESADITIKVREFQSEINEQLGILGE